MKTRFSVLVFIVGVWALAGCASIPRNPFQAPSAEDFLDHTLLTAAEEERRGDPVEALKQYRIALTVSPDNPQALQGRSRLEKRLTILAEEQYKAGEQLQREGNFAGAREQFLAALRLRPDHPEALRILTSKKRMPVEEYVIHTLLPGESLSKLALQYYGDPEKFGLIARYNQIADARLVQAGRKIKVPLMAEDGADSGQERIPEAGKKNVLNPQGYWDWSSLDGGTAGDQVLSDTEKEGSNQIASYRELGIELFREGRYQEALFEFNKVLCVHPDDGVAADYSFRASFELGLTLFQMKDYLTAREHFLASLHYKSDCRECVAYVKESEELYKEMHYKQGIEFYGKEQLVEAIRAWEMVQKLDPDYKRVDYYIRKAREIQTKLEELKRETQEGLAEKQPELSAPSTTAWPRPQGAL